MTHAMTLRLPDDVYEALRQEAFDRRMTLTAVILARVADHPAALAAEGERIAQAIEDERDRVRATQPIDSDDEMALSGMTYAARIARTAKEGDQ